MEYHKQSPSGHSTVLSALKNPHLTTRSSPQRIVPTGIVAIRIAHLHNLAVASASIKQHPPQRLGAIATRYGRSSLSNSRSSVVLNSQPHERAPSSSALSSPEAKMNKAVHQTSFQNLGVSKESDRRSSSPKIVELCSMGPEHQYEKGAVELEKDLSKKDGTAAGTEMAVGAKTNSFLPKVKSSSFQSFLQNRPKEGNDGQTHSENDLIEPTFGGKTQQRTSSQSKRTETQSSTSRETTLAVRYQSVRDLYARHGISRPASLLSSDKFPFESGMSEESIREYHVCHVCHESTIAEKQCWRCGHNFCVLCHKISSELLHWHYHSKGKFARTDSTEHFPAPASIVGNGKSTTRVNNIAQQDPQRSTISASGRATSVSPFGHSPDILSDMKPVSKDCPELYLELPTPRRQSTQTFPRQTELPLPVTKQKRHEPCSLVSRHFTDSPVLNKLVSSPPSPDILLAPTRLAKVSDLRPHGGTLYWRNIAKGEPHSRRSSSEQFRQSFSGCSSPGCRATHVGHRPYRHSISCTRVRLYKTREDKMEHVPQFEAYRHVGTNQKDLQKIQLRKALAESHEEHQNNNGTNCLVDTSSKSTSQDHQNSSVCETNFFGLCLTPPIARKIHKERYIECTGYPRTGHAMHASPVGPGVVGKWQHCLNDCQCESCQATHHNVRCCMHEDHPSKKHHHRLATSIAAPKILQQVAPLSYSERSAKRFGHSPPAPADCLPPVLDISLRRKEAMIMPKPKRNIASPPWLSETSHEDHLVESRIRKPFLQSRRRSKIAMKLARNVNTSVSEGYKHEPYTSASGSPPTYEKASIKEIGKSPDAPQILGQCGPELPALGRQEYEVELGKKAEVEQRKCASRWDVCQAPEGAGYAMERRRGSTRFYQDVSELEAQELATTADAPKTMSMQSVATQTDDDSTMRCISITVHGKHGQGVELKNDVDRTFDNVGIGGISVTIRIGGFDNLTTTSSLRSRV